MGIFSRLFGSSDKETTKLRTTAAEPYRIANPRAGFICLSPELEPLMKVDAETLGGQFSDVYSSTTEIKPCHVLFLYCKVEKSGEVSGAKLRIRDFIKAAGAYIAIVASENDGENYMQSLQPENDWPANLVLVIDRRGNIFTVFFKKLFEAMRHGTSMLIAWVELAPQIPGHDHPDCPETIMIAEGGHIALDGRA